MSFSSPINKKKPLRWKGFPRGYKTTVEDRARRTEEAKKGYGLKDIFTADKQGFRSFYGSMYNLKSDSSCFTGFTKDTMKKITELAKNIPGKVIINDVGFGSRGRTTKENLDALKRDEQTSWIPQTSEPFEIASALADAKKKYKINGYTINEEDLVALNSGKISVLSHTKLIGQLPRKRFKVLERFGEEDKYETRQIPKSMMKNIKAEKIDIMTSVPAHQADFTVCLRTLMYLDYKPRANAPFEREVALKHLVDSTKVGGYLVLSQSIQNPHRFGLGRPMRVKDGTEAYFYPKIRETRTNL